MTSAKVSFTRCPDYNSDNVRKSLLRHFELLGPLGNFVSFGDTVLIKPNLIAPRSCDCPAQTHPAVIIELAKILIEAGAKPFVADSPAWADAQTCAAAIGLIEPLKKLGVKIEQLDSPVTTRLKSGTKVGISSKALDADKIINLPKLKAHQQLGATIAVKNMFGCISGKAKAIWHFRKGGQTEDFCKMLIEIYELLAPAITIIDAVVAMEGPGPIRGTARDVGCIVASTDPLAAERLCCQLIGFNPHQLPILQTAAHLGLGPGDMEKVEVLGDDYHDCILSDFLAAQQVPLRFSLPRILKSISRQILLVAKSKN